jgi:two-component system chemotaxis response regulator CheY
MPVSSVLPTPVDPHARAGGQPSPDGRRRPTAVVVDDSATVRIFLRLALERAGYVVVGEGSDGESAQALYERHRPDLLTLDVVLPLLDGVAAVQALLSRHPEAVVVMCSSLASRDKVLACRQAGVKHFLLKPFEAEKLTAVARALAARPAPDGGAAR